MFSIGSFDVRASLREVRWDDPKVQLEATGIGSSGACARGGRLCRATRSLSVAGSGAAIAEPGGLLKLPGDLILAMLRLDPEFDRLRGDSQFENLLKTNTGQ
jgi:hypothetical protein